MGNSVFGIGISGMNAAQAGLITTGHNISNASTPGFSRQEIVQTTNLPQYSGVGYFGQGATVSTVKRMYNEVLSTQLIQAQSQGKQIQAYSTQINQISNLLGDPSAGLAPALQEFFAGVANLASDPASVPSRQAVLASANVLTARFQGLNQQFDQVRSGINTSITSSIGAVNSYAQQIAGLNQRILVSESASSQQQANDLRDQRDALFASLNEEVNATVVKSSSGSFDVFIGNGQPLVLGTNSFTLAATPALDDPQRIEVGYQSGAGPMQLSASSIQGGTLGGLLAFRSNTLDPTQNGLGRIAIGLAKSFNNQHALGQDLNGALAAATPLGGDFFALASPAVLPNTRNTGGATLSASFQNAGALTTSDYQVTYDGLLTYKVTRMSDGLTQDFLTTTFNVDGLRVQIGVGAQANDSWTIQPTRNGARDIAVAMTDPAGIAAASPIRTGAALANTGNGTISAGSVANVGNLPGSVSLTYDAAASPSQFTVIVNGIAQAPIVYTAGSSILIGSASFTISGTPADGDIFTLDPNTKNAVSDNRNALALGALQSSNTLGQNARIAGSQPTTSFQGAYSQLVSLVGNTARQMDVNAKAQTNLIAQTKQSQQSVSGVNLDEEAANLLRYQQAYQASGKMMQIASSLFQTVLDLGK